MRTFSSPAGEIVQCVGVRPTAGLALAEQTSRIPCHFHVWSGLDVDQGGLAGSSRPEQLTPMLDLSKRCRLTHVVRQSTITTVYLIIHWLNLSVIPVVRAILHVELRHATLALQVSLSAMLSR